MERGDLTTGKFAMAAGVNVETIRFYQRTGLVAEPMKPVQGCRLYPLEATDRVRFIKRAKDARRLAEQKCTQINARITDLRAMCETLKRLVSTCHSEQAPVKCAIIEAPTTRRESQNSSISDSYR